MQKIADPSLIPSAKAKRRFWIAGSDHLDLTRDKGHEEKKLFFQKA
jgi:hypothetical protein